MYACPKCGGGLRFDIETQQIKCDYCNGLYDPYTVTKEEDAARSDHFGAAVYVCPNCGGEIISSDDTAAAFCSYCGESVILSGKMREEKCPAKIIPFKLTKAQCKERYEKAVRRSVFAPKAFLDPAFLDRMTGIYMPYWLYDVEISPVATLTSTDDHRKGDYIYHEHYKFTADADLTYSGIQYDAASAFSDTISADIAPFHMKDAVDFTPSYLSGFFADIQDVGAGTYTEKAGDLAAEETFDRMKTMIKSSGLKKYGTISDTGLRSNVASTKSSLALLPVWFLTWRRGDRVSYAVINGETGEMSLDLPVDIRKYLIFTAILTVPVFLILESFVSMRATSGLLAVIVIALISMAAYYLCKQEIHAETTRENDTGYQAKKADERLAAQKAASQRQASAGKGGRRQQRTKLPNAKKSRKKGADTGKLAIGLLVTIIIVIALFTALIVNDYSNANPFAIPVAIGCGLSVFLFLFVEEDGTIIQRLTGVCFLPIVTFIGCVVVFLDLHSDFWYYGFSVIILVLTCLLFISLIRQYNLLATRPMPYFKRSGGDHHA